MTISEKNKELISAITFEIAYNNRHSMISCIKEHSGDEFEQHNDLWILAKKSKSELRMLLKDILEYKLENE